MKTIEIQRHYAEQHAGKWRSVFIAWMLIVVPLAILGEVSNWKLYVVLSVILAVSKWMGDRARKVSCSKGKAILLFGEKSLVFREGRFTVWHIPYQRFSHIQTHSYGKGKCLSPRTELVLVHTTDGDTYSLPVAPNRAYVAKIQAAVLAVKTECNQKVLP